MASRTVTADPFWSHKPGWCQPWSILLSGTVAITASWWLLHRLWITLPLTALVLLWWLVFLVLVPSSYRLEVERAAGTEASGSGPQAG